MTYSRHAIPRKSLMTLQTAVVLIALGAVAVAVGTVAYRVSPWWAFGVACVPAAVVLVLVEREISGPCSTTAATSTSAALFETAVVLSVTLFAAAALAGIVDGVRMGTAGRYGAAFSRLVVCPLTSAVGVGLVLYGLLGAALRCLD
jgi:hypothetical protein